MSRRHHHHMQQQSMQQQPYDYDRFGDHSRDRDRADRERETRAIEYQDDSLSSINSDDESYLHHQHQHGGNKDRKPTFYNPKNETGNKSSKADKTTNNEPYHQKETKVQTSSESGATTERLTRLETMLEELIKRSNPPAETTPPVSIPMEKKPSTERRGQFSLEPRRQDFTTSMWINKIQEVSIQNNWDEKTTISYMGSQMSGIIKAWYNNLPNYDYTWPEWKILITKMFPDNTDFVTSLKRLVTRLKQADETVMTYYFSKMYLIEACKITGEDAVSCLIDGLNNQSIQEQAKAQSFLTPETLYSQFLMVLPEYNVDYSPAVASSSDAILNSWCYQEQNPNIESVETVHEDHLFEYEQDPRNEEFDYHPPGNQDFHEEGLRLMKSPPKRLAPVHSRLDKRFMKPNTFKYQNKVPMAAKVCSICFNRGHLARNCRNADKMMCCKLLTREHNKCFFKKCVINHRELDAFVDTGCTTVTIRENESHNLDLNIGKNSNYLMIYGGGTVPILGEAEIDLEVDSVRARVRAVIVPDHVQDISVVIGQGFLNKKNVCVLLQNEELKIFEASVN